MQGCRAFMCTCLGVPYPPLVSFWRIVFDLGGRYNSFKLHQESFHEERQNQPMEAIGRVPKGKACLSIFNIYF